jgi:hypothetical protein
MSLIKLFYYFLLFANITVLLYFHNSLNKRYTVFVYIFALAITVQILGDIKFQFKDLQSLLFHIYIPLEFFLLCIYYSSLIKTNYFRVIKNVLLGAFILSLSIYYYSNPGQFLNNNFTDFILSAAIITLFSIMFFIDFFRSDVYIPLKQNPDFWINIGSFFFYSGTLFYMGVSHLLPNSLVFINYILNLIMYTFYLYGFLCLKNKMK